jgi:hypothetical protein
MGIGQIVTLELPASRLHAICKMQTGATAGAGQSTI